MANREIDSFVKQFKLLRDAGIKASLNMETILGEISISISCKVGRNIPPQKKNTPTGASTNPKNFDLSKNLNMNLI